MSHPIFLPLVGQHENIGDIMLRRPLAEWLRPMGTLHIYVGPAPQGYIDGLALAPQDVVYTSLRAWYMAGLKAASGAGAHYVFMPGEIQLSVAGMKEPLGMLPLLALIRFRGGGVARVGAGARNCARFPRLLMRPSLLLSPFVAWRDGMTATFMGMGGVMPDLAFSQGDSHLSLQPIAARRALVISMRGDRGTIPATWLEGMRMYAASHRLDICVVTQVMRDSGMSRFLARELGGRLVDWNGEAHDVQETRLRQVYREARVVISDRLHVLIAAFTHGALPVGLPTDGRSKIERHFSAAGIRDICVNTDGLDAQGLCSEVESRVANQPFVSAALSKVRTELDEVRVRLERYLAAAAARLVRSTDSSSGRRSSGDRPTVWHVGRKGEVAGGMTQVVNGYLDWSFPVVRVKVIRSRAGTRGPHAWLLFMRALLRVLFLRDPERNVVVVHLSYGGSFIREGLLLLVAHARGFGTVAHLHGGHFLAFAERRAWLVRMVLRAATSVFVLSEAIRQVVTQLLPSCTVHLVPNAVPQGKPRRKEQLVVFGGRVSVLKGVDVLVGAWKRVSPGTGWKLELVGPIIDAGVAADLPDATFRGACSHAELMALLDHSAIAVLPSRVEVMPMFILEALARGNCVISTRVGAIPALLGDGCGILTNPGDEDDLAAALQYAMSDDEMRQRVADAGRERFEDQFSTKAIFPRVEALWLEALKRRTRPGSRSS
jgi:glycosyltransferase involved in cell wall biosynthesis